MDSYTLIKDFSKLLFANKEVNLKLEVIFRVSSINKAQILWNRSIEDDSANSCIYKTCLHNAIDFESSSNFNFSVKADNLCIISHNSFVAVTEDFALAWFAVLIECKIV